MSGRRPKRHPVLQAPPVNDGRRLPTRPEPVAGEALDGYLERLAAANHLTHPALLRLIGHHQSFAWVPLQAGSADATPATARLAAQPHDGIVSMVATSLSGSRTGDLVGGDGASASWRGSASAGWAFGRGTQLCPTCLGQDGIWRVIWRHPWVTICLTHRTWLHTGCPTCSLPFRSYRHHVLRSVDAPAGTCGNPAGHRGRPCPQDLEQLPVRRVDGPAGDVVSGDARHGALHGPLHGALVVCSQTRIQGAAAGREQYIAGSRVSGEEYLAETKALTVLLLHLAVQPGGHALAPWADAAHLDRDRTNGPRTARWGLAPPTDPRLRGHALAAADHVLGADDLETAAGRLHRWTELTPRNSEGQLGWLADHTHMTPTLTRLVMSATASSRRISTLLDHQPPSSEPPTPRPPTAAIPQVMPADLYRRHLAPTLDVGDDISRSYASLCLARRTLAVTATTSAAASAGTDPDAHVGSTWSAAARALRIPHDLAEPIWRHGSRRVTSRPDQLVHALDLTAAELDPTIDYRAREDAVRRIANHHRWYRAWARTHHPGSHLASRTYAVTWLWTQWARALTAASPGWTTPPDHITRSYYRRYAARLSPAARTALIGIAEARLDLSAR